MKYILAIDQGTTSSRAILYNERLQTIGVGQHAFPQYFPEAGWVEHDLNEIWESVSLSIRDACSAARERENGFRESSIVAIGITNQRETFGLWDRASGQPVGRAIVWQCRRSDEICRKLRKTSAGRSMAKAAGLVLDPYFSGTKLKWRFDRDKKLLARAKNGEIAFGTIDTFLISRLTGGLSHATDVTNASRTLMMDLKKLSWSSAALKTLGVPEKVLPKILDSDGDFGSTKGLSFLPDGIPIRGVLGDQQAALFGQECFAKGDAKCTYGTGAFLLMNIGDKPRVSKNGLTTVGWRAGNRTTYALEGAVFIAGAAVQWIRDGLQLIETSSDVERLAGEVPDSDGVFFIPALSGLGSPYWFAQAKGLIGGLTRRSTKAHVARATLDGIAFSVAELAESLRKDSGASIKRLRVDGGASKNPLLMQRQADLSRVRIERPVDIESTARGAAAMAAWGVGLFKGFSNIAGTNPIEMTVAPKIPASVSKAELEIWRRRVKALIAGAF